MMLVLIYSIEYYKMNRVEFGRFDLSRVPFQFANIEPQAFDEALNRIDSARGEQIKELEGRNKIEDKANTDNNDSSSSSTSR
jgi:hypothetical protein